MLQALKKEEEHQKKADHLLSLDERKRPYNSMYDNVAPTDEEMEAWRMKHRRTEDPMSHFTQPRGPQNLSKGPHNVHLNTKDCDQNQSKTTSDN